MSDHADGSPGAPSPGPLGAPSSGPLGAPSPGSPGAPSPGPLGGPVSGPGPAPGAEPVALDHRVLTSLLGAWALAACSPQESLAVEAHLGVCGPCADEALRLRDAVGLLHPEESLDLDPELRSRVLARCLDRRPPRIPVPEWAVPYDTETARLDALLMSLGDGDWHAPVRLRWFEDGGESSRRTTVAGVISHLMAVDGLVATALGLPDPLGEKAPGIPVPPGERTETCWSASALPPTRAEHRPWRDQTHALTRTVAFTDGDGVGSGLLPVSYGGFALPLRDALVERAFECWVHAGDIAGAVDYPYARPVGAHLHRMIDLATRLVPQALAALPTTRPEPGARRRTLRLEIEGPGGGEWRIDADPGASAHGPPPEAGPEGYEDVAQVRLDGVEFCMLAAGHLPPEEAAAGQEGDRATVRRVLTATASLSRL